MGIAALASALVTSSPRSPARPVRLPLQARPLRQRDPRRFNVLVIVVDSLRADHLSFAGHHHQTSPELDEMARQGYWFDDFFTATAPTVPACTTLFTGQHALTHRVLRRKGGRDLDPRSPWLPELLAGHGYCTGAIDNLTDRKPWFARGFHDYINLRSRSDEYHTCFQMNRAALRWIDRHRDEPFFLYMRYGDTHTPYRPPRPFAGMFGAPPSLSAGRDLRRLWQSPWQSYLLTQGTLGRLPSPTSDGHVDVDWCRAQYDAGVRTADAGLSEVRSALRRMGLEDRTIVIVLGDHGESLGEHGIYFDHYGLYDAVLRPPLVVYWPGGPAPGRRVPGLAQMQDLCPTILDLLGIPVPPGIEGRSLGAVLRGESQAIDREWVLACECNWGFRWAMRTARWKLIVSRAPDPLHLRPEVELYDVGSDPAEHINLAASDPPLAADRRNEFESILAGTLARTGAVDPVLYEARLGHPQLRWRLFKTRLRWDLWFRLHERAQV